MRTSLQPETAVTFCWLARASPPSSSPRLLLLLLLLDAATAAALDDFHLAAALVTVHMRPIARRCASALALDGARAYSRC